MRVGSRYFSSDRASHVIKLSIPVVEPNHMESWTATQSGGRRPDKGGQPNSIARNATIRPTHPSVINVEATNAPYFASRFGISKVISMSSVCIGCREDVKLPFEFKMAFQPIVDMAGQRVWGYEALVRGARR